MADEQKDAALVSPPLSATPQEELEHFWFMLQNGWDIESRDYFEREARSMGFRSPVEMAVHHMWKRHAKDWPNEELKAVQSAGAPLLADQGEAQIEHDDDDLTRVDSQ